MDGGDEVDANGDWKDRPVTAGPWVGWNVYGDDHFEDLTGPFYWRRDDAGQIVCGFRAERRHMNGSGFMHGGALLTFADYALFVIGREALAGSGSVTASMNAEFVDGAQEGEMIEARGDVVRAARSMVFMRGLVTTGERPLLNFSAIVKKTRRG